MNSQLASMQKYCLLSNDVETTSIRYNTLSDKTGERVLKEGMPILLEIYEKYQIKSSFFFTGYIAKKFPDIVKMVLPFGHEVGCHGLSHKIEHAFDVMSLEQQYEHLKTTKAILEDISGIEVISFRAPALRVNHNTPLALTKAGFKIDSSIASQRFDMFLSFGSLKKMNRLLSPRLPYFAQADNLARSGNGPIFEIPISAFLMPYIGTTMRIFPGIIRGLRYLLNIENKINHKPIVFLIHPNEFLDEEIIKGKINRRAKNFLAFLLGDLLRSKLKTRNLGKRGALLYEQEISFFEKQHYQFITMKEFFQRQHEINQIEPVLY